MLVISIASDHGGVLLREKIILHLEEKGYSVIDHGTHSRESVDYPDYSRLVVKDIENKKADLGVLVCGTGIGMSIAANKSKGIRAAVVGDVFSAQATRAHNNTNVLCLGERVTGEGLALTILDTWLETEYEGGRHQTRLDKINGN